MENNSMFRYVIYTDRCEVKGKKINSIATLFGRWRFLGGKGKHVT